MGLQDNCPIRKSLSLFEIREIDIWPWVLGIILTFGSTILCLIIHKKKKNTNYLEKQQFMQKNMKDDIE